MSKKVFKRVRACMFVLVKSSQRSKWKAVCVCVSLSVCVSVGCTGLWRCSWFVNKLPFYLYYLIALHSSYFSVFN